LPKTYNKKKNHTVKTSINQNWFIIQKFKSFKKLNPIKIFDQLPTYILKYYIKRFEKFYYPINVISMKKSTDTYLQI